jgi:hypothetical protein
VWSADGRSILIRVGEHGNTNLKRVDVQSGKVDAVTTGDQEVMSYTADAKGARSLSSARRQLSSATFTCSTSRLETRRS